MNLNNCDILSKYKKKDLDELFEYLNSFVFSLRNRINIDNNINFGVEIEYANACFDTISECLNKIFPYSGNYINDYNNWFNKVDDTVIEYIDSTIIGGEINSPILNDNNKSYKDIEVVCDLIKNNGGLIDNRCGGHIHINNNIIDTQEVFINFLKIWSIYEKIIYRFCFNEFNSGRNFINGFASPISYDIYNQIDYFSDLSLPKLKGYFMTYSSRAFRMARKGTIEFRCPNGTLNPTIWQNNINLFCKLLLYCKSNRFNHNIINNHYKKYNSTYNNYFLYKNVDIDMALEFCDLIFDNNLDKLYFLKQYIKNIDLSKNKNLSI